MSVVRSVAVEEERLFFLSRLYYCLSWFNYLLSLLRCVRNLWSSSFFLVVTFSTDSIFMRWRWFILIYSLETVDYSFKVY